MIFYLLKFQIIFILAVIFFEARQDDVDVSIAIIVFELIIKNIPKTHNQNKNNKYKLLIFII